MLTKLKGSGGSDLHLGAGSPPRVRVKGELTPLEDATVSDEELRRRWGLLSTPNRKRKKSDKRSAGRKRRTR